MTSNSGHLVAVLGMHRSGTSAVSRSLQVLGVSLGENLMPAHSEINAKGFWEDNDFVNLNIEICRVLGRAWHSVAPICATDLALLEETDLGDQALALTNNRLSVHEVFGVKDPRLSNLAPFWMPIFRKTGARLSSILSIRHPASVAQSLAKRDGFTTEHGYLLWIDHVITSVSWSEPENRVMVDYDLLMNDPQHQLQRMSKQLGLPVIESELAEFKNEFLDDKLRHTAFTQDDLDKDPSCPPIVRDCYRLLLEVARDNVDLASDSFRQQMHVWQQEHARNLPMLQLLDERWKENAVHARNLGSQRAKIDELTKASGHYTANVKRLESEVKKLESARSALESRTHDLVEQLAREKSALADQLVVNNQLTSTLNSKEREIIDVRNSTSWRITAPIRWARELLSPRPATRTARK